MNFSRLCLFLAVFPVCCLYGPWSAHPCAAQISLTGDYNPSYNGFDNPWNFVNDLNIGINMNGSMRVEGTYVVDNDSHAYLGYNNGVHGEVLVAGGGSLWDCLRIIHVGLGGSGLVDIENGGHVISGGGRVGDGGTGVGEVQVSGAGSRWDSQTLEVGYFGQGTLGIGAGGIVSTGNAAAYAGQNSNSGGSITVSGANSQFLVGSTLFLGYLGNGSLRVENGGYAYNREGTIGTGNGTNTSVVITGPGSQWINDQNLTIGLNGDVTVDIQDGGYVGTSRDAFIAKNSLHTSTVNVTGAGSHWNIDRNLYVGGSDFRSGGTGTLNIEDGGLVTVANTMTIWSSGTVNVQGGTLDVGTLQQDGTLNVIGGQIAVDVLAGDFILDGGTLAPGDSPGLTSILGNFQFDSGVVEIEIAGLSRGTLFDAVDVSGTALLNGVFDVNLISGFSPLLGDSFLLIDANMLSGTPTFDFSEAVLSQGLGWDTSNFLSTGTISVGVAAIPEPGSAGVLFVTTASLLLNRGSRRRSIRA